MLAPTQRDVGSRGLETVYFPSTKDFSSPWYAASKQPPSKSVYGSPANLKPSQLTFERGGEVMSQVSQVPVSVEDDISCEGEPEHWTRENVRKLPKTQTKANFETRDHLELMCCKTDSIPVTNYRSWKHWHAVQLMLE